MRSAIHQVIQDDQILGDMGLPGDSVFAAETVETPVPRPFIVVRWLDVPATFRRAPSQRHSFDVWVYDKRGDYSRIDAILSRIHTIFSSITAQATDTGFITQIDWTGDGPDSYDDVYESILRIGSYVAIASYIPQ